MKTKISISYHITYMYVYINTLVVISLWKIFRSGIFVFLKPLIHSDSLKTFQFGHPLTRFEIAYFS